MSINKQKVLCIINNFAVGGSERIVLDITTELVKKHFVAVATVLGGGPFESEFKKHESAVYFAGPHTVRNTTKRGKLLWLLAAPLTIIKLTRYIYIQKPNAVMSSLFLADVLGMPLARILGVQRRIVVQHDVHEFGRLKTFLKVHVGLRNASHVVAVSEAVKDFLCITWKLPREKVSVIHNGLPIGSLEKGRRVPKPGDALTVGFLGRLEPIKGPQYFLAAVAQLAQEGLTPRVLIAGTGSLEGELKEYAHEYSLDNVSFIGLTTDAPRTLREMDIVVIPSEEEGFGLVALEALFAHKVVIASDLPAFREFIVHGENGFLVAPRSSNAIADSIRCVFMQNHMLADAHTNISQWTKDNSAKFDITYAVQRYEEALGIRQ